MNAQSIFSAMTSRRMASLIRKATHRIIYAAPGIQTEPASALAERCQANGSLAITVSLDFDEHTLRMGYGTLKGVETLKAAGIGLTHSPGLRSGILIVDDRGWVFTPTALYLEEERQSNETPNAVEMSCAQVTAMAIRLSPIAQKEAAETAPTREEAQQIALLQTELGVNPVATAQFDRVKAAIEVAPPARFDVVRQVRVFEPYLQYVELSLIGAAVQRHRVRIPRALQNIGSSNDLEGKLNTTFDLIEKGSSLSSDSLEAELTAIRKNFTPSLGKDHGRVVLKAAKPQLVDRVNTLRKKVEEHQKKVENELQAKLDESRTQVAEYYFPLVQANPPDGLVGSFTALTDKSIQLWIDAELRTAFPLAKDLTRKMSLDDRYKDVTFETLNRPDFIESVKSAFPHIDWDKTYSEFKAAGEVDKSAPDKEPS